MSPGPHSAYPTPGTPAESSAAANAYLSSIFRPIRISPSGIQWPHIRPAHVLLGRQPPYLGRIGLTAVAAQPLIERPFVHALSVMGIAGSPNELSNSRRVARVTESNSVDASGKNLLHDPMICADRRGIIPAKWNDDLYGRCPVSAGCRAALNQPGHELAQLSRIVRAELHLVDDQVRPSLRQTQALFESALAAPAAFGEVVDRLVLSKQFDRLVDAGRFGNGGLRLLRTRMSRRQQVAVPNHRVRPRLLFPSSSAP